MATPTTVNTWPLNGSIQEFDVTFDYLSQTFIKVNLVGPTGLTLLTLGTDYTFVTPTRIRTTVPYGPPTFTTIELRRETSTTERLVEFQDASILHAKDLNVDALQVMHVAEEARNAATETLGVNGDGNLDARNRRIVNALDPIDPADVVTLNYYTSQVTGTNADRLAAEAARDKAQEWAIKPTAVAGMDQSSKTYAGQASTSAGTAATQAGIATTQAGIAATQAGNAAGSASSASGSASASSASAGTAAAQAGIATTQADIATTQAGIATAQAGIATTKAAEAASNALSVDTAYLRNRVNHTGPLNWAWATYGGTANTVTLAPAFTRTAYVTGDEFRFRATAFNTGPTTINVGGLGAKVAVTVTGAALPAGYIRTDVDTVCVYDGTQFVVQREIESGNNSNGVYTRFANGLQTCQKRETLNMAIAAGAVISPNYTFAAAFTGATNTSSAVLFFEGLGATGEELYGLGYRYADRLLLKEVWVNTGKRPSQGLPSGAIGTITANSAVIDVSAIGRWY